MGEHLAPVIVLYDPALVMRIFREHDRDAGFHIFLQEHLTAKTLRKNLKDCKEGRSENVVAVSAAIRHVFAHGVLTANANDMNPGAAHEIGTALADFLFSVMDAEFTKTITAYCAQQGFDPSDPTTFRRS